MSGFLHKERATSSFKSGDLDQAKVLCEQSLSLDPTDPELWCLLATIYGQQRKFENATVCAKRAIALAPEYIEAYYTLGRAQYELQNYSDAIANFEHSTRHKPNFAEAHLYSAHTYLRLKQIQPAINSYRMTIQYAPSNIDAYCGLANAYESINEHTIAEQVIAKGYSIDPMHPGIIFAYAVQQRRKGNLQGARSRLIKLLESTLPGFFQANVANELGHLLDQLGCYDEAFGFFAQSQHISSNRYTGQFSTTTVYSDYKKQKQLLNAHHNLLRVKQTPDDDLPNPVFLIGFPRSGTTLVEQILAAHSQFVTSDERLILENTIRSIPEITGINNDYPECIVSLTPVDISNLRAHYWKLVHTDFNQTVGYRFVDKQPLNMTELAFIRCLFPSAPVIYIQRDPRDVCISCFFQLFKLNRAMLHFTDLRDTVNFYTATMDLWEQYGNDLKSNIFRIRYEHMTSNMESIARSLLEFLNEDWESSVLEFYAAAKRRHISTPSANDVTTPIYTRSVGRWVNYKAQLEPFLRDLEPYIRRYGYKPTTDTSDIG